MIDFYLIEISCDSKFLGFVGKFIDDSKERPVFTKTKNINSAIKFNQDCYTVNLITLLKNNNKELKFKSVKYNIAYIRKLKLEKIKDL